MTDKIRNFRDLDIWKKGIEIVKDVYWIVSSISKEKEWKRSVLRKNQATRYEIAEGFNRFHNKEYKQFLYVALGSCAELETHIEIALELKYIDSKNKEVLLEKIDHESRMLTNLIKKVS